MPWQFLSGLFLGIFILVGLSALLRASRMKKGQANKILIVLGSGGHTAEMLVLLQKLGTTERRSRAYVVAATDSLSAQKAERHERSLQSSKRASSDSTVAKIYKIPRSREVGQSYLTSMWTTVVALAAAVQIVLQSKPDMVLVNGPGTCIPICAAAFLFRYISWFQSMGD